jgi:putative redox-active protein with C_GCAxxG_C_C motif
MVEDFAKKLFLGQQEGYKRLNCAQAIAEAFKDEYGFITDQTIKDFKKMGHGKAPNGECGMLFAAKYIFEKNERPDEAREFEKNFLEFAGTTKCKELVKKKIPFCAYCINETAKFIDKTQ